MIKSITKSIKQQQQDIEAELADIESELFSMGEHAPQEQLERVGKIKAQAEKDRQRITALEKKYARVKREAERAVPAYQAMIVEMPKWRTTILLGLNSAAIVAAIARNGLPGGVIQDAIWLFLLGALSALASGSALDVAGHRGLEVADQFQGVDLNSPHIESELDQALLASKRLFSAHVIVSLLRYASLGFFALGVLSISNSIT